MNWTSEKQQAIEAGAKALWKHEWGRALITRVVGDREVQGVAWYERISSGYLFTLEAVNDTEWGEIVRAAAEADERCARCDKEKTARGGDVHCSGDCDHFQHDEPDGCHNFVPSPFDPLALFSALLLEGLAKGEQEQGHPYRPETPCANCEGHPYSKHQQDVGDRGVGMDGSEWCEALGIPYDDAENPCPCSEFAPVIPSWFETHAPFGLPCNCVGPGEVLGRHTRHALDCPHERPFIIPPLTFTYDDGAEQQ